MSEILVQDAPHALRLRFGRNLERLRVRANYTKTALARRVGVTRQTIDNWEGGDVPPFENLLALMDALPASLQDLFGDAYTDRPGPTQEELIAGRVMELVRELLDGSLPKQGGGNSIGALMASIDEQTINRLAELLATKLADKIGPELVAAVQKATMGSIQAAVRMSPTRGKGIHRKRPERKG